jgi:hypothetical protein
MPVAAKVSSQISGSWQGIWSLPTSFHLHNNGLIVKLIDICRLTHKAQGLVK